MKKVINYIKRQGGQFISHSANGRSQYYILNKKVIRISDHIGVNSKCFYSIICLDKNYLFWNYSTGEIDIVKYEDIKCFIRNIKLLNTNNLDDEKIQDLISVSKKINKYDGTRILGIDATYFSQNQLKQIDSYIQQVKKKFKIK